MTVWAASLPMRGQLLEKSIYRVVGTILGSLFGIALLVVAQGQLWVLVVALSVWVGLCAGAAILVRGFASYGVMLAGYSAAMVTLLHNPDGSSSVAIGIDRMLTVLLGVGVALAVGWMFASRTNGNALTTQCNQLAARVLEALAHHLSDANAQPDHSGLLAEIAMIEEGLDANAAGSLRSRQAVRAIRRLLSAQVATLLWMRRTYHSGDARIVVGALKSAADALQTGDTARAQVELESILTEAALERSLRDLLAGWAQALRAVHKEDKMLAGDNVLSAVPPVVLHQDWVGARETFLRTVSVTLATGLFWLATGWSSGAFMMLGTAIMTTVFSTADNPVKTLRLVFVGQVAGAAGALACRWLAWPLASNEAGLIAWMALFVMLGAFIATHRRTAIVGFDYNMVLLLMLQPVWPLSGNLPDSLATAGAIILGPVIALLAYRMVFPINEAKRLQTLVAMMVHEIEALAQRPNASSQRTVWRARLYHRLLRLVRWAEKSGYDRQAAINGGFTILLLGSAILHMDELLRLGDLPAGAIRRLNTARARLSHVSADPLHSARMLQQTIRYLKNDSRVDVSLLNEAAASLLAHEAFVRKAKGS